ncbi:hypothetical protein KUCAC02_004570, partial [Chaenocephalus aceratus]
AFHSLPALEYSHIRPPTQNNNRHLTARQSLGKLDDYGSRHRQIDGNILLRDVPPFQGQ